MAHLKVKIFIAHPFKWAALWVFPLKNNYIPQHLYNRCINSYYVPFPPPPPPSYPASFYSPPPTPPLPHWRGGERLFWAPNGTRLTARCHFKKPQKVSISRAQPLPLVLVMVLHASNTLHTVPYTVLRIWDIYPGS